MSNKSKKVNLYVILGLAITLLVVGISVFVIDKLVDEERDYALNKEMFVLVGELDKYKKDNGKYPETLREIRVSDQLCVTNFYKKCRTVKYMPIQNQQDFHLAMKSFTWVVLWYRKDACFDTNHYSEEAILQAEKKFRTIYYFCGAAPEVSNDTNNSFFPVYRKDKDIFDNPSEWPEL